MTALELRITRPIDPIEVLELISNVWRDVSPWVHAIDARDGGWDVVFDDGMTDAATRRFLSPEDVVPAIQRGLDEGVLCCGDALSREELGYGCAQDVDIVLQFALLGELVYG